MSDEISILNVLLVEDNHDDVLITKRALKESGQSVSNLWVVRDGQEAMDFLRAEGAHSDRDNMVLPGLILLDINLPKKNGLDVLDEIKADGKLHSIPVVMLTSSKSETDLIRGYKGGCNSFIQKPVEFERFIEVVGQIGIYWGLLNVEKRK